jgi:hypothetical protein
MARTQLRALATLYWLGAAACAAEPAPPLPELLPSRFPPPDWSASVLHVFPLGTATGQDEYELAERASSRVFPGEGIFRTEDSRYRARVIKTDDNVASLVVDWPSFLAKHDLLWDFKWGSESGADDSNHVPVLWTEAAYFGNGMMGALVMVDNSSWPEPANASLKLNFAINRVDAWTQTLWRT